MKAKTFFIVVLVGVAVCLGAAVGLLSAEDPFFVTGGIAEDETALFDNQRYQMAGLIRHQDYSAVVMGTSLAANYQANWFTDETGKETLKITFPDGWISEFDTALGLAFRTHPQLDRVYFCLDPNILIRPDSQRTVELPHYLYNQNPLDDVEYFLNADTYVTAFRNWMNRDSDHSVPLGEAYIWDNGYTFSREVALGGYQRPEVAETVLPGDAYLAAAEENMDVVCSWLEAHPNAQFAVWFPPYSILYWDMMTRGGKADAILNAVEYATERLLDYDNVTVHCFLGATDYITDLDNYTDHIHCSSNVTRWVAYTVIQDNWQYTRENYRQQLEYLRGFVRNYDYESIFQ